MPHELSNSPLTYLMNGVYSCGYNVLLGWIHQTPAATNTQSSREGTTGVRPEWRKANPKPSRHSQLCMNCCRHTRQSFCLKERLGELPPPTCKCTVLPQPAVPGLSCTSLSQLETGIVPQTFPGAELSLFWKGSGEWELSPTDCEAQKSSGKHILETITVSFLQGTRLSNIVLPFFQQTPWYLFAVIWCIHYLHESSAKQCYKMKKQIIVLSNSIKL